MSKEHWDRAAERYSAFVRGGKDEHARIYEPAVQELLGDVAGKQVLDAGCGEGRWVRELARSGASVIGIDGSDKLIRLAEEAAADHEGHVRFIAGDLLAPLPFPDDSFDLVLANMVLMDMPRIDTTASEIARVLVPGGAFVFSIAHPCFFTGDWVTDGKGGYLHKELRDYLHEQSETLEFWGATVHYHRPLHTYFGALEKAGLVVESLREPVPSEEMLQESPDWERHCRIPSFLVIRARLV